MCVDSEECVLMICCGVIIRDAHIRIRENPATVDRLNFTRMFSHNVISSTRRDDIGGDLAQVLSES